MSIFYDIIFWGYAGALSSDEIRDLVLANAAEVDTYKYTFDLTTTMLTGNETNVTEMTVKSNARGMVDVSHQ